jgi:hypothetical protein
MPRRNRGRRPRKSAPIHLLVLVKVTVSSRSPRADWKAWLGVTAACIAILTGVESVAQRSMIALHTQLTSTFHSVATDL